VADGRCNADGGRSRPAHLRPASAGKESPGRGNAAGRVLVAEDEFVIALEV
jgi:hypothetical protein